MLYSRYKKHYGDCKTVKDSYDEDSRTVIVQVPDGRMKPSGVRGQKFNGYYFEMEIDGKVYCITYRAVSYENALKRLLKEYNPVKFRLVKIY